VPVHLVAAPDLRRFHRSLHPEVTMIPSLAAHLRRSRPGFVHSFHYCDAVAADLAGRLGLLTIQGMPLFRPGGGGRLRRRLLDRALDRAPMVTVPSQAAADHLREGFGREAVVLPNALHTAPFALDVPRRPNVIFCAATGEDERKRVGLLVDAHGRLLRDGRELELWLGGEVNAQAQERLRGRLPDAQHATVRFLGNLSGSGLARAYASAAVTCLPSLYEAFGVVLVESLAAGTPVAGCAHAAIPEIIDEEVGGLFPPESGPEAVDLLASCLADLLDRASAGQLVEACRARAQRYDWSVLGPRYLEVYAALA